MLFLLLKVGDDHFAIEFSDVAEVIPKVPARPVANAPRFVAGIFEYRSEIVPCIDLCKLICDRPAADVLSTRIILVRFNTTAGQHRLVGLTAEKVVETFEASEQDFQSSGISVDNTPYLGRIITINGNIIQSIKPAELLPAAVQKQLFIEAP